MFAPLTPVIRQREPGVIRRMAKRARPKTARTDPKTRRPGRQSTRHLPSPGAVAASATRKPLPPIQAPDAQGVALFQQAVEALQRKRYDVAATRFRVLLELFPGERALLDRTRVYLDLAERELNRRPANPRTTEERVTAATAALNNDQDAEAERLLRGVLAGDPRHDLALYLMAAVEARRGEVNAALSYLGKAIAVSPEVRAQARHDSDFELLRNSEVFQTLVDPPSSPSSPSGSRRPRRGYR